MNTTPDMGARPANGEERYQASRRITLIGAAVDLLLSVLKIVVGVVGGSQALVADGIHSLSDLATDAMVLIAAKHGSRDADEDHPYGHGRFETVMTVILGSILILVAAGIAWDAVRRLFQPELLLQPGWPALAAAAVSIVAKEVLYVWTLRVAKRLRSPMLKANAWHHRSDAISSVVVLVGVAGTMAGLDYLDSIAAFGVALMVAKIGGELAWHALQELVDTSLESHQVEAIRKAIQDVGGVRDLHLLRTRRMGGDALVDVHIEVDPRLSVSEGHQVGERVRHYLIDRIDDVADVMVHIDPENDERGNINMALPSRDELIPRLEEAWREITEAQPPLHVTLHYLAGRLLVDVMLPLDRFRDLDHAREVARRMKRSASEVQGISTLHIFFFDPLIEETNMVHDWIENAQE